MLATLLTSYLAVGLLLSLVFAISVVVYIEDFETHVAEEYPGVSLVALAAFTAGYLVLLWPEFVVRSMLRRK